MTTETPAADTPEMDETTCAFCEQAAQANCPRCNRPRCADHGGAFCDACTAPLTGAPSRSLFLGAGAALAVSALLGVWLLFASPRLSGEKAPPPGASDPAPAVTSPPRAGTPVATAAATPAAARTYTVKAGDTMGLIAQSFSISVEALIAANPGVQPDSLQVGQELVIPPAAP